MTLGIAVPSRREGAIGAIMVGLAALVPGLVVIDGLVAAPLLVVAALALLPLLGWRQVWRESIGRPLTLVLAAGFAWCALSLLWTVAPVAIAARSLVGVIGPALAGATLVAAARRLDPGWRDRTATALLWGLSAALLLVAVAVALGRAAELRLADPSSAISLVFLMYGRDRGTVVIALLLWTTLAEQVRLGHRRAAWLLGIAAALILAAGPDLTVKAALLAGLASLLLVRRWPRTILALGALLMVTLVAVSPLLTSLIPPPLLSFGHMPRALWTLHHRLTIWRFVGGNIFHRPLVGFGLESSRILGGGQVLHLPQGVDEPLLPLHPHDGGLQVWLELGAVGVVLLILTLAAVAAALRRRAANTPPFAVGCAAATLVTGFVVAEASFGLWQSWWLSALWLGAAYAAMTLEAP